MTDDAIRLDINAILKQLPHRYPFLLVDRVVECHKGKSIRALQECHLQRAVLSGPLSAARPVMPGVMILEALAQTAAFWRSSRPA